MFDVDQSHGLKYIIERFDKHKIKYQFEKRNEIRDCLQNLYDIDLIIKGLHKENSPILHLLEQKMPGHRHHFLSPACTIISKIILLMEEEDYELGRLRHAFTAEITEFERDKISHQDIPEETSAKKLETWACNMIGVVKDAYSQVKDLRLKELKKKFKNVVRDMKWFTCTVQEEEYLIKRALWI
jgi:hypothetical protein